MFSVTVKVSNRVGLPSEEAPIFVQLASSFKSNIWLESSTKKVNAKTLLGVIAFGLFAGVEVKVTAVGSDEEAAARFVADLIEGKRDISFDSLMEFKGN